MMSGLEVPIAAAQIGIPLIVQNQKSISSFIKKQIFRLHNFEYNIYATMTMRFKTIQQMDRVSEHMIKSISEYKVEDKDCSYKIDNVLFTVIPEFTFNDDLQIENFEYDLYPKNDDLFIPGVKAFTIYFFTKKATKQYLPTINKLVTLIEKVILENYPVKQHFSFLYLQFDNSKNKLSFQNHLQKQSRKFDTTVYFLNSKSDELKLNFSSPIYSLIANIL